MRKLLGVEVALLTLLVATVWLADEAEQWLRYNAAPDRGATRWGASSQKCEFTTAAPDGLALPEFKGNSQIYAKWETPMVEAGFVNMAFDLTRGRMYDVLYIDSNCDGSLADEAPVKPVQVYEYGSRFGPVRVVFPSADGPITHHLYTTYQDYQGNKALYLSSAGRYEGPVRIDGKEYSIVLIDFNSNGTYNDLSPDWGKGDLIVFADESGGMPAFVGKYVALGGKLYEPTVARDGASIAFAVAKNVPMGALSVPAAITRFSIAGENGLLTYSLSGSSVDVPVGKYRVFSWEINRPDKSGAKWQAKGSTYGGDLSLDVTAGGAASLDVGEPFKSTVAAQGQGRQYYLTEALTDKTGGRISITMSGTTPPAPRAHIKNADGTYDRTFQFQYG